MMVRDESKGDDIAAVFVGTLAPHPEKIYGTLNGHEKAYVNSANLFQINLIRSVHERGIKVHQIFSAEIWPSFPRNPKLFIGPRRDYLNSEIPVIFAPFINLYFLKNLAVSFSVLLQILKWGRKQKNQKTRLIISYNLTYPHGLAVLLGAKLIGAKALAHISDVFVPGELIPCSWLRRLDYKIQTKIIPRYDMLSVVNKHIVEDFVPRLKDRKNRYVLVEGGVSQDAIDQLCSIDTRITQNKETFDIVYAGSLCSPNNIELLLEGFLLLDAPDVRLHIAGNGPLAPIIEQASQRDPRIIYKGLLTHEEVLNLYKNADLLVNLHRSHYQSSRYRFPCKVIEYLLSGRSLLLTNIGHTGSEFGEFVYLLRDESAQGFVDLVKEIRQTPPEIREAKAQLAREYILQNKTWDAQGEKIAKFVKKFFLNHEESKF